MATKLELISDMELRLTEGKPSGDLELEYSQIGKWFDEARDLLATEELNLIISRGNAIPRIYIEIEKALTVLLEVDGGFERRYIELTNYPLDLHKEGGLIKLVTSDGDLIHTTNTRDFDTIIKHLTFSKATKEDLVGYREGKKIYLDVVSKYMSKSLTVDAFYIRSYSLSPPTDTELFRLSGSLTDLIKERVESIGRRQIYNSDGDYEYDGQQGLNNE